MPGSSSSSAWEAVLILSGLSFEGVLTGVSGVLCGGLRVCYEFAPGRHPNPGAVHQGGSQVDRLGIALRASFHPRPSPHLGPGCHPGNNIILAPAPLPPHKPPAAPGWAAGAVVPVGLLVGWRSGESSQPRLFRIEPQLLPAAAISCLGPLIGTVLAGRMLRIRISTSIVPATWKSRTDPEKLAAYTGSLSLISTFSSEIIRLNAAMETSSMSRLGSRVVRCCKARFGRIKRRTRLEFKCLAVQRIYS